MSTPAAAVAVQMFPAQSSITLPPRDKPSRIFLFDVDGTLTVPRNEITPEMAAFIADLRTKVRGTNPHMC
jgi:hypothetical protein